MGSLHVACLPLTLLMYLLEFKSCLYLISVKIFGSWSICNSYSLFLSTMNSLVVSKLHYLSHRAFPFHRNFTISSLTRFQFFDGICYTRSDSRGKSLPPSAAIDQCWDCSCAGCRARTAVKKCSAREVLRASCKVVFKVGRWGQYDYHNFILTNHRHLKRCLEHSSGPSFIHFSRRGSPQG